MFLIFTIDLNICLFLGLTGQVTGYTHKAAGVRHLSQGHSQHLVVVGQGVPCIQVAEAQLLKYKQHFDIIYF